MFDYLIQVLKAYITKNPHFFSDVISIRKKQYAFYASGSYPNPLHLYKSLFILISLVITPNTGWAQTNLFGTPSATSIWNSSNINWGTSSGTYTVTKWLSPSLANIEGSSGTITVTGFNPNVNGIVSTNGGLVTIAPTGSERIMLTGSSVPTINTGSNGIRINTIMGGGLGFTKSGSSTLTLANVSNTFHGTVNINAGTVTFPDISSEPANSALRHNPVNITSGTLTYSPATNQADIRLGTLTGSGILSGAGSGNNGIFSLLTKSGSSSATISTVGLNGYTVRGLGGFTQTLTGNLTGIRNEFQINGVSNAASGSTISYTTNVVMSGSTSNRLNHSSMILYLNGKLTLDNSINKDTLRLGTATTNTVDLRGGTLELIGNTAGTSQAVNSTIQGLISRSGSNQVIVNTPSGATSNTELVFGSGGSNFSLRGSTAMTVNFAATGNNTTLGGASSTDPKIRFSGSGQPHEGIGSLLSASAGGSITTVGWATVNGNSFATHISASRGIGAVGFTTLTTASTLRTQAANSVIDFAPTSTQTLTGSTNDQAAIRISPNGGTTLNCGSSDLNTYALMLDGTTDYTITGTGDNNAGASKYIYVNDRNTTLTIGMIWGAGGNPISKSGNGIVSFNSGSSITGTGANRINILNGTVRSNSTSIRWSGSSNRGIVVFRGGVFELSGGSNGAGTSADFRRDLGTSDGDVNWNTGTTGDRGSGGFSAFGSAASVNLGGSTTPSTKTWDVSNFVLNGYSLLFGSTKSDARLTFYNPIALDGGIADYNARNIHVYDNTASSNDKARLAGVISGSANSDLLKSGPCELELSASNTYNGNTLIQEGTLTCVNANTLPAATNVILLGGTLALSASQQITSLVLESGSSLALGANTLTLTGNLTNNGGTITGTGTIIFAAGSSTTVQCIDGTSATTFPGNLTINNTAGVSLSQNITVNGDLTINNNTELDVTNGNFAITIKGNWNNQNTASDGFIQRSGKVTFNGSVGQSIRNNFGKENFHKLRLNGVSLTIGVGGVDIKDSLILSNGPFYTDTSRVLMEDTAKASSGSINSFVDGRMRWEMEGTSEKTFPVGDSTNWARASITPRNADGRGAKRTFEVEYVKSGYGSYALNTSLTPPLDRVSRLEYWKISEVTGATGSDLESKIKLYWTAYSSVSNNAVDRDSLRVAHYVGSTWTRDGNVRPASTGTASEGSVQSDWVTSFSPFTLASNTSFNPLPVSLIHFRANCSDHGIVVEWKTAQEYNNDYFELQRITEKGTETITKVQGTNSSSIARYTFTDKTEITNSLYRLVQNDYNGKKTVYGPIPVRNCAIPSGVTIQVWGHTFWVEGRIPISTTVCIHSSTGSKVLERTLGITEEHFDLNDLSDGIYYIYIPELGLAKKIAVMH